MTTRRQHPPTIAAPIAAGLGIVGASSLFIFWIFGSSDFFWAGPVGLICVILALYAGLGGLIGRIAWRKGRSYYAFFWLSVLINPLVTGIIAAAIAPAPGSPALDNGLATKPCPMCAETVKSEAKVCRFCGHEFA